MEGVSKFQDFWIKKGDTIEEWFRLKFHTIFTGILTVFNFSVLGLSALSVWLGLTFHLPIFSILPLLDMSWSTFLILVNIPLITWFYSTITFPIKKGYKVLIDWSKTEKGRMIAFILNVSSLVLMLWVGFARYAVEHYIPPLSEVQVSPREYGYLLITNMDPFITLIYLSPFLITVFLIIFGYRHYSMNHDILKNQFFSWEFKPIARFSYNLEYDKCDVIVGWDKETNKPLVLKENSRFLHELVSGATGSGKTSTTILLRIAQDLVGIAKGKKMSIVLLEPKGDAVDDVLNLAKKLGVPDEKIFVVDPTRDTTTKFNPFFGPLDVAAESFRGTLDALTGDQDEFFKGQQNETAALFTMLAKLYYGDLTNVTHIQRMYTDARFLANLTEGVRIEIDKKRASSDLKESDNKQLDMYERVVRYFEDEVLDYKTFREKEDIKPVLYPDGHRYAGRQVVENKKDKFVTGAKKYLNDISMNAMLSDLMVAKDKDKVLNLEKFLDEGGVLLVNTALGELEELSLMFGQFFIRQFQSAVFRRPKEKDDYKRSPVFFYVDEFPLFINQAFERLRTLGRSYKVGTLIALQSLGQLESVVRGYKETILTNASTKTVFGRGSFQDNKIFSDNFGEEELVEESMNESTTPITVENPSWGLRHNTQKKLTPRFTPTQIAELPFKHMIVQMVKDDGSIDIAKKAYGKFVSEAKFLKKYFNLGALKLNSENQNEVDVDTYLDKESFTQSFESPKTSIEQQESFLNAGALNEKVDNIFEEEQDYDLMIQTMLDEYTISIPEEADAQLSIELPIEPVNEPISISATSLKKKKTPVEQTDSEQMDIYQFEQEPKQDTIQNPFITEEPLVDEDLLLSRVMDNSYKETAYSIPDKESLEHVNDFINSLNSENPDEIEADSSDSDILETNSESNQEDNHQTKNKPINVLPNGVMDIVDEIMDDI